MCSDSDSQQLEISSSGQSAVSSQQSAAEYLYPAFKVVLDSMKRYTNNICMRTQ